MRGGRERFGVVPLVTRSLVACLFPIMRSVTRRMNRQLDTIAHQALLYPATDLTLSSPSIEQNADAPVLS